MLESFTGNQFEYKKLSAEEQKKRGILGRLVGVIADTVNPTRNGRKYTAELWEKVFQNPIMQEKIKNRVCFGEICHPMDGREEVDPEKVAICLAEIPKKNSKGQLIGVFDILSTPCGKILKTMLDYGTNIGVSSRGSGDIITDYDGNEEVDPDTYDCICWDAVFVPAVKEARLNLVSESLNLKEYAVKPKNKIKLVAKDFPYTIKYGDREEKIEGVVVVIEDGIKYGDGTVADLVVYCEGVDGEVINFTGIEEAQAWIDKYGNDCLYRVDHLNELHATPKEAYDVDNWKPFESFNLDKKRYNKTLRQSLSESIENANDEDRKIMEETLNTIGININESLKSATPYMLRNDGKVFECGVIHPYIKMVYEDDDEKCINKLFNDSVWNKSLQWFYNNTQYDETREEIKKFVKSVIECKDFNVDEETIKDTIEFDYNTNNFTTNKDEIISIYINLNNTINQEFCKVRTSDMRCGGESGDIYFRISSVGFNWFDIIWDFVENNKNFIETVTICKDTQSFGGGVDFVKYKNIEFNMLPVDEFLSLEGKPELGNIEYGTDILNKAFNKLKEGKSVLESFNGIHPVYAINYFNKLKEGYITKAFNTDIKDENPDIDETEEDTPADNDGGMTEAFQNLIKEKQELENTIGELQEKLSVCYAKESKLEESIAHKDSTISMLSERSKTCVALKKKTATLEEQLKELQRVVDDKTSTIVSLKESQKASLNEKKSLNESVSQKDIIIEKLQSKVKTLENKISSNKSDMSEKLQSLTEELEETKNNVRIKRAEYDAKIASCNKMVESYKKSANAVAKKYIELQSHYLGVKPQDIISRLSEGYSLEDVDRVCESLQTCNVSFRGIPIKPSNNVKITSTEKQHNVLGDAHNFDDTVDDTLLILAGIKS